MLDRLQGPTDQRAAHGADLTALRIARWLLLLLLLASYPLAGMLPLAAGRENGWMEDVQLAILLAGFFYAIWLIRAGSNRRAPRDVPLARLATVATPIWLLCVARETSWGATLFTPGVPSAEGRYYTSSILWYHSAIAPFVIVVAASMVFAFVRWRLDRPLMALIRARRFPWFELGLAVFGALLSALAEGKLHIVLPGSERMLMVMEEGTELLCYSALFLMQFSLFSSLAGMNRSLSPQRA